MAQQVNEFEVYRGQDGQYYARLQAINGEIVWQTEGYKSKQKAKSSIYALIGIVTTAMYDIKDLTDHEVEVPEGPVIH